MPYLSFAGHNVAQRNTAVFPTVWNLRIKMLCCKHQVWFPGHHRQESSIEKQTVTFTLSACQIFLNCQLEMYLAQKDLWLLIGCGHLNGFMEEQSEEHEVSMETILVKNLPRKTWMFCADSIDTLESDWSAGHFQVSLQPQGTNKRLKLGAKCTSYYIAILKTPCDSSLILYPFSSHQFKLFLSICMKFQVTWSQLYLFTGIIKSSM